MAFAGIYVDPKADPKPADHGDGCDVEALSPYLVSDAPAEPGYTMKTRSGHHHATVCNREGLGADLRHHAPCDKPVDGTPERVQTQVVQIQGFTYTPGDVKGTGPVDRIPTVAQGETLTWVNNDALLGIRHTVTSCRWPCNGPTTMNYPQASGLFDSEKMGNADPISGGANGVEDVPAWSLDTSDLEPGLYAYYDRVHPWMRGWFEVTEGEDALLG